MEYIGQKVIHTHWFEHKNRRYWPTGHANNNINMQVSMINTVMSFNTQVEDVHNQFMKVIHKLTSEGNTQTNK